MHSISCPSCDTVSSMKFVREEARYGFCYSLSLQCTDCDAVASKTFSSQRAATPQPSKPFIVNELIVLFFNQIGLGHSAMKKFASLFGWQGLHHTTYHGKEGKIISTIINNTADVLKESIAKVKESYLAIDPTVCTTPLSLTVSFDGSWHKRGHTSMYGVATVIDICTGLVIDYVVLSKYCHACTIKESELGVDSTEFNTWYDNHKDDCAINYVGSSNAMEMEAACRLWSRSEVLGLRYTGFLSDGDSKAFKAVSDLNIYEEPIVKEECVNHVHKRMGTALRHLNKSKRLGGKGQGRLTQDKTIKFQHYYRFAVMNNIGDSEAMRNAIWATLFHCASTDISPQHEKCPDHAESWCFFNKAVAKGELPPSHTDNIKTPLDWTVAKEMIPIYERLSDPNLLKRMIRGKTQNANESLHNVIWSRCPKTIFVGKHKLHGAVATAISSFNEGAIHMSQVLKKLAIEPNQLINMFIYDIDSIRIQKATKASISSSKSKKRARWVKKRQERHNAAEGTSTDFEAYQAGGY